MPFTLCLHIHPTALSAAACLCRLLACTFLRYLSNTFVSLLACGSFVYVQMTFSAFPRIFSPTFFVKCMSAFSCPFQFLSKHRNSQYNFFLWYHTHCKVNITLALTLSNQMNQWVDQCIVNWYSFLFLLFHISTISSALVSWLVMIFLRSVNIITLFASSRPHSSITDRMKVMHVGAICFC